VDDPTEEEQQAWLDYWLEESRVYHERLDRILAAHALAQANPGCEVCQMIAGHEITPKDVPEFLDAVDRAGPLLGARVTVCGIWSLSTSDVADHQAGHTRSPE
jgi:hypothetical protein